MKAALPPIFSKLEAAVAVWTRADLSAERHIALDQQGLEIADNQERSAEGRDALKEVIRQFRAVAAEERPAQIGSVIRAFQAEVDALTRRQSSAETAFLSLYRSLDDVPDPVPLLREVSGEVRRLAAEAAEVEGLRQRIADYDREFASLKNQEATIRRLERQLREVDSKSENVASEAIEAALAAREAAWKEQASEAAEQHREREQANAAKLLRAQEEAREAARAHQQAQESLFEMRSSFEQVQEAAGAEMEVLRAELERATATQLATEKQRAALEQQLHTSQASPNGSAAVAAAERAAADMAAAQAAVERLEGQLSHKELQLAKTSAQLSAAERHLATQEDDSQRERSVRRALEAKVAELAEALSTARARAATLPSAEEHAQLQAELAALRAQQQQLTMGAQYGADSSVEASGAAAEALSTAAELLAAAGVTYRDDATATAVGVLLSGSDGAYRYGVEGGSDRYGGAVNGGAVKVPVTPGTTPVTPGGGTSAAAGAGAFGLEPLASSSADDAFKLVCGQRERARRQVQDLEVEMAKLAAISHGHQAEARRLQADNLKLYEKVKFLQSTVAAAGHSRDSSAATPIGRNSIEEQATEGRYHTLYEEKVNPFAAFHQRERQQRYAELPAPEKLMLNFSQFFLANRHARLFLFGYMVCLHLLVSGAMYAASHHC